MDARGRRQFARLRQGFHKKKIQEWSDAALKRRGWVDFLFIFPTALAFVMVIIVPFFLGIYYAMTDWDGPALRKVITVDGRHWSATT